MRYMKAREGGAVKTYIGKREGVAEKPIFAYQGGGGVEKQENPAYIVYGWSLSNSVDWKAETQNSPVD